MFLAFLAHLAVAEPTIDPISLCAQLSLFGCFTKCYYWGKGQGPFCHRGQWDKVTTQTDYYAKSVTSTQLNGASSQINILKCLFFCKRIKGNGSIKINLNTFVTKEKIGAI